MIDHGRGVAALVIVVAVLVSFPSQLAAYVNAGGGHENRVDPDTLNRMTAVPLPITVVVPFYQGARFLPRLVNSLEVQRAGEVVIVVDGGEGVDEVRSATSGLPNVRVLTTAQPLGTARARNFGARDASQPWVTFLDQDDAWPANFLAELIPEDPDDVYAYDNRVYIEKGAVVEDTGVTMFSRSGWTRSSITSADAAVLMEGFPMVKLVIPTHTFVRVGGFRDIYAVEDFDIVWRLLAAGARIRFRPDSVGRYVVRDDSTTGQIASGDFASSLRAQRSWLNIWFRIAGSGALPLAVRVSAAKNDAKVLRKVAGLLIKRALRRGSSPTSQLRA